jgi:AhpD family alkylhydroperoxidase
MSTQEARTFYEQWSERMSAAKASSPDAARGFGALFQATMKAGALSVREKELIALGIGVAMRCDPCVYAHVQKAIGAGASREQVLETAGVAVMMQGGPAYTYLPKVVAALDALAGMAEG